jgi:hypothetical protein
VAVAVEIAEAGVVGIKLLWCAAARAVELPNDVRMFVEMRMGSSDTGIEDGPADSFALGAVTDICRPRLHGMCGIGDQRLLLGVAPKAGDLQVIVIGPHRFGFEPRQFGDDEVPQRVDLRILRLVPSGDNDLFKLALDRR